MSNGKILKLWLPVLLWMAFIYWASTAAFASDRTSMIIGPILRFLFPHAPDADIQALHGVVRKLAHLTEYFILGLLLFRALRGGSKLTRPWHWALTSLVIGLLFAAGDEFHQSFVATRTASVVDVGIDFLGGVLAQCVRLLKVRREETR